MDLKHIKVGCLLASMLLLTHSVQAKSKYISIKTDENKTWQTTKQTNYLPNGQLIVINQPVIVINHPAPSRYRVNQTPNTPWYSQQNKFVVAGHPEAPVLVASQTYLKRGEILSENLYNQGTIVYRAPRGIVVVRIGNTSVKIVETTRKILQVSHP